MAGATANTAQTARTRETAPAGALAPVVVREIELEGRIRRVEPPLVFSVKFNTESGFYEMSGAGDYDDIFLADDTTDSFKGTLLNIILPDLWEEYALEEDENLSPKSLALKNCLRERAE